MNDVELVEDDHYKISVKEDEHLFRLDVLDIAEDHCGKIKVVAKNENGEDSKEVSEAKIPRNNYTFYRANRNVKSEISEIIFILKHLSVYNRKLLRLCSVNNENDNKIRGTASTNFQMRFSKSNLHQRHKSVVSLKVFVGSHHRECIGPLLPIS